MKNFLLLSLCFLSFQLFGQDYKVANRLYEQNETVVVERTGAPTPADNPSTESDSKLYLDEDTGELYTWNGTAWILPPVSPPVYPVVEVGFTSQQAIDAAQLPPYNLVEGDAFWWKFGVQEMLIRVSN